MEILRDEKESNEGYEKKSKMETTKVPTLV